MPETPRPAAVSSRVLTVPNLLSFARLAGVPLFLWLLLGPQADGWAVVVLAFGGFTDWLDGKLARLLDQTSEWGAMLDPVADRLYIFVTLIAFLVRGIIPWWLMLILVMRDVVLACTVPFMRRRGFGTPEVHYVGKAATFNLLYAFPLLLLAVGQFPFHEVIRPIAYAFTIWGGALYMWAGVLYLVQTREALRSPDPRVG